MFKFNFAFLFVVLYFSLTEAWVMRAIYHNAAHPGKCYVNEHIILLPGQSAKSPEGCSLIQCSNANGDAQVMGCGAIMPPPNCSWDGYENVNADFPLCCVEKFKCANPADEAQARELQKSIRDMYKRQLEDKEN